ncbi:hypothetical protein POSPLADRAFT_1033639 [Postia placenta MAD-698-R-SB12]|uniref:Uncharacterized protein n=1 Tax=Postia placenta MAD-698-R-SB12 TaxID=670580 RepID=A0A1X6N3E0_9APHY|nr:hypothetical protein POSPLADRAFT_1033639 [Postia placenta MAD-698-R-SB12]OSX63050.1 hypothetical protein POSPLADRAFT_1033639 [Postia placenta MAD-698-R-SB12]
MLIDVTMLSTRWTASGMFRSVRRVYDNQKSYSMGHAGAALGLLEEVIDDKPATLVSRLKLEPYKSISSAPGLSRRPRENLTESTGTADLRATGGGEVGVAADTVSMSAAANAGRAEQCSSNAVQSELWPSLLLAFCGQDTSQPSGQMPSNDVRITETLPDGAIIPSWCNVWSPVHSPKSPQPSGLCRRASQRAPSSGFTNAEGPSPPPDDRGSPEENGRLRYRCLTWRGFRAQPPLGQRALFSSAAILRFLAASAKNSMCYSGVSTLRKARLHASAAAPVPSSIVLLRGVSP